MRNCAIIHPLHLELETALYFTGHSLGGGLAQFVALVHQVRAIVFNSAGLGLAPSIVHQFIPKEDREAINRNIINIWMKGDVVHKFGLQFGQPVALTPSRDISPNPGTRHMQGLMINTIKQERERAIARTVLRGLVSPSSEKPIGGVSTCDSP